MNKNDLCRCADVSQPREPHAHHIGSQGEWTGNPTPKLSQQTRAEFEEAWNEVIRMYKHLLLVDGQSLVSVVSAAKSIAWNMYLRGRTDENARQLNKNEMVSDFTGIMNQALDMAVILAVKSEQETILAMLPEHAGDACYDPFSKTDCTTRIAAAIRSRQSHAPAE